MILRLVREPSVTGATLGVLFVDGHYQCFTLEPQIREQEGQPVSTWKVPGQTAIPAGRYRVTLVQSPRFGRLVPLLIAVPGFTAVEIHTGNTVGDTRACVVVGRLRAAQRVGESKAALDALVPKLEAAIARNEAIWITVENPPAELAA